MNDTPDIRDDELLLEDDSTETAPEAEQKDSALPPDGRTEIVGIRFKKNGKTYYFAPNGYTLSQDERVIVDTARGQEYGFTAVTNREIRNSELSDPLRSVIRLATPEDTKIHEENVRKEIDAFNACIILIDKHKLGMKLIDAELAFDRSKLIFYFSAEGRVDFRELVKDLASSFHTRIEMRQIGIRDEAKILGGLGICGRPYCCNTFLTDFGQVSVKMAKEQNLSLNSAKISGSCGRLMCCLRYEYDTYLAEKALTPKVDSRVVTPSGAGTVVAANPLAGIVKVRLDSLGEESEAVVFVREDVVDESKYDGQVLTKTEIPDRKHKSDDIPSLAEFSTPTASSAATVPTGSAESAASETSVPETEADSHEQKAGGNRHKHKKHPKAPSQPQPQQKGSEEPAEGGETHHPKPHHHGNGPRHHHGKGKDGSQPHGDRQPRPQGQKPQVGAQSKPQSGAQPKAPAPGGEGAPQQPKKNKRWKKPYHHNGNKSKPTDGGEAK